LKLLVDADAWQFGSKTKLIFYIFFPLLFKKCSRATDLAHDAMAHVLLIKSCSKIYSKHPDSAVFCIGYY